MNRQLVSVTDAVPYQEFAKLIGKTPRAVRGMIEKGKLPVIEITDPQLRIPLYSITDWHRSPISDSHPFDQPGT